MSTTTASARVSPLKWLRDRGVRTKILSAVLLTAVVALVVGVMGLRSLSSSADAAEGIYTGNVSGVTDAAGMETAVATMRIAARNVVLGVTDEDKQAAQDSLAEAQAAFDQAAEDYVSSGVDAKRQAAHDDLVAQVDAYQALQQEVLIPLAEAGDETAWWEQNAEVGRPITDAIADDITALNDAEAAAPTSPTARPRSCCWSWASPWPWPWACGWRPPRPATSTRSAPSPRPSPRVTSPAGPTSSRRTRWAGWPPASTSRPASSAS